MRDKKITLDIFLKNGGFSAKHFVEHTKYFMQLKPADVMVQMYREKIVVMRGKKSVILKCHYNGRSDHYASILSSSKTELITFHKNIEPGLVMEMILNLIK